MESSNETGKAPHARWGQAAVAAGSPDLDANDDCTNAVDTIANVLHYAHAENMDTDYVLRTAAMHYEAEIA